MDQPDYDAPLEGENANERDVSKHRILGLTLAASQDLAAQLSADISAEAWGYRQLDNLADEIQRAAVSEQIRSAARGIAENLGECRLHELEVRAFVGPNGLPMPRPGGSLNDHLRNDRLELHVGGFLRAFGSTLDCLAATLIGVLRVPMSLQRADMGRLGRFDPEDRGRNVPVHVGAQQREVWAELVQMLDAERRRAPDGWYVWGLAARNAQVHRGRGLRTMVQRPTSGRLAVVSSESPAKFVRFDYFLPRRPSLPGIIQMAKADGAHDLWLPEPVQDTLAGLFERLNAMVERLAAWAHDRWREQGQQRTFVAPERAWRLPQVLEASFAGFGQTGPGARPSDAIMVNPDETEYFRLAEQLRLRMLAEAEAEGEPEGA